MLALAIVDPPDSVRRLMTPLPTAVIDRAYRRTDGTAERGRSPDFVKIALLIGDRIRNLSP